MSLYLTLSCLLPMRLSNISVTFKTNNSVIYENCKIIILRFYNFTYMSGNSQGVKRPYLGHKVILCNTLMCLR